MMTKHKPRRVPEMNTEEREVSRNGEGNFSTHTLDVPLCMPSDQWNRPNHIECNLQWSPKEREAWFQIWQGLVRSHAMIKTGPMLDGPERHVSSSADVVRWVCQQVIVANIDPNEPALLRSSKVTSDPINPKS